MELTLPTHYAEARLPRYTSYPTAPHFSSAIAAADYRAWLAALSPAAPVSLYLHVPFCKSMCWYCGCHTVVTHSADQIASYTASLCREIAAVGGAMEQRFAAAHIHFGGGTPTILGPDGIGRVFDELGTRFTITPATERAIEIDPRTLTEDMAKTLGLLGFQRASLGVQTMDHAVQQAINRVQPYAKVIGAVNMLRDAGVRGINVDLIYGLPGQTVKSCSEAVEHCLPLRPNRFSVFGYAHVPSFKPHQKQIVAEALPDFHGRHEQAEAIAQMLTKAGYMRIGFDHFALPDDEMAQAAKAGTLRRNFQGYTTDTCETLIGFGASAIGRLPQGYVQNDARLRNYHDSVSLHGLATMKGYRLTADDRLRADIIERLMCDLTVDVAAICAKHGTTPQTLAATLPRLQQLAQEGLVELDGSIVRVPEAARMLVRVAASAFDAYLHQPKATFSRAV